MVLWAEWWHTILPHPSGLQESCWVRQGRSEGKAQATVNRTQGLSVGSSWSRGSVADMRI